MVRGGVTPGFPKAESLGLNCSESWKGLPQVQGFQEPLLLSSHDCGSVAIPEQAHTFLFLPQGRASPSKAAEFAVALLTSTPWGLQTQRGGMEGM